MLPQSTRITLALLFCSAFALAQTPQNSGIGTSTPGSKLEIKANSDETDTTQSALHVRNSAGKSLLFVRNDGKIGLGTKTFEPSELLALKNTILGQHGTLKLESINDATIMAKSTNTSGFSGAFLNTKTTTSQMYITSYNAVLPNGLPDFKILGVGAANLNVIRASGSGLAIGTDDESPLNFSTNNTVRMVINSSGKVGIGMTPASGKLFDLKQGNASLTIGEDVIAGDLGMWVNTTSPSANNRIFRIDGNGYMNLNCPGSGSGSRFDISVNNSQQMLIYTDKILFKNGFYVGNSAFSVLPTAFVDIEPATSSQASLRIRPSTLTLSAPNDGDIWYDGSNLKFRKGNMTVDLTSPPSGGGSGGSNQWTDSGYDIWRETGNVGIGILPVMNKAFSIKQGTASLVIGEDATAGDLGMWVNTTSPSANNRIFRIDGNGYMNLNCPGTNDAASRFDISVNNSQQMLIYTNKTLFKNPIYVGNSSFSILPTAFVDIEASTTSAASIRLRSGVAPTTPNNGDVWFNDGLFNFKGGLLSTGHGYFNGTVFSDNLQANSLSYITLKSQLNSTHPIILYPTEYYGLELVSTNSVATGILRANASTNNNFRDQFNSSGDYYFETSGNNGTSYNEIVRFKQNGNVGIGTSAPVSTFEVSGSEGHKVVSKTSDYTAANEAIILADASSGDVTITLPAASSSTGRTYSIKKTNSANNVIIDANGSETIDGATTKTLSAQYSKVTIVCDGSNWFVIED